ncbi:MAG: hypothetical protein ABIS21_03225 [Acidimicrobiales bacterium]
MSDEAGQHCPECGVDLPSAGHILIDKGPLPIRICPLNPPDAAWWADHPDAHADR